MSEEGHKSLLEADNCDNNDAWTAVFSTRDLIEGMEFVNLELKAPSPTCTVERQLKQSWLGCT